VVSKDSDFKNSFFINRTPQKVIKVSLGNLSNKELIALFEKYLPFILQLVSKKSFYVEISVEQILITE